METTAVRLEINKRATEYIFFILREGLNIGVRR